MGCLGAQNRRQKKKRKERKGGREGRERTRRMNQGPARASARAHGAAAASGAGGRGARGLWAAGWGPGQQGPSSSTRPPVTLHLQRQAGPALESEAERPGPGGTQGLEARASVPITLLPGGLEPGPRPAQMAQRGHRGQQRTDRRTDGWTRMELECGGGWGRQPEWGPWSRRDRPKGRGRGSHGGPAHQGPCALAPGHLSPSS